MSVDIEQAKNFSPSVAEQAQADQNDPRVGQRDAAQYLGVSVSTLIRWKARGVGPKAFKLGGRIQYRQSELDAYVARCEASSSAASDAGNE